MGGVRGVGAIGVLASRVASSCIYIGYLSDYFLIFLKYKFLIYKNFNKHDAPCIICYDNKKEGGSL